MLKPNDKALCIHAAMDDATAALFSERLVEGRVYAVRGVDPEVFHDGHQSVHLVGIQGHVFHDGEEVGFCSTRFRQLGDGRAHETTTAEVRANTAGQPTARTDSI
jgi:hypothetical protein